MSKIIINPKKSSVKWEMGLNRDNPIYEYEYSMTVSMTPSLNPNVQLPVPKGTKLFDYNNTKFFKLGNAEVAKLLNFLERAKVGQCTEKERCSFARPGDKWLAFTYSVNGDNKTVYMKMKCEGMEIDLPISIVYKGKDGLVPNYDLDEIIYMLKGFLMMGANITSVIKSIEKDAWKKSSGYYDKKNNNSGGNYNNSNNSGGNKQYSNREDTPNFEQHYEEATGEELDFANFSM